MNENKLNRVIPSPESIGAAAEAFRVVAVAGQSDIVADSTIDTLTVVAGANITLTTNATTDSLTIASSGGSGANLLTNFTAGETINAGQLVYMKSDGNIWLAQADGIAAEKRAIGISQESKTVGQTTSVLLFGLDATQSGLTAGTAYYLSESLGSITSTIPTTSGSMVMEIGIAVSAGSIIFNPRIVGILA